MSNSNFMRQRSVTCALLAMVAAVAAGCSDGRAQRVPVSGVVKIDGVPVTTGFITFVPTEGRSASGDIDSEGRFTLSSYKPGDGVLIGTHNVEVMAREAVSETSARWHAPKKYTSHKTSGITVEIDKPTSDVEINLTWDGGKPFIESDT
ncbi:hypothetical protein [Aeoliella sp. SH292]|uniref:hypothetical protein n=1 Tax=Aeoliella sp. SH292 TaxID=3454464 RepID=UPI003F9C728D